MINEDYIKLECESDAPDNWLTNVIYRKDTNGNVFKLNVPDDIEEGNINGGE